MTPIAEELQQVYEKLAQILQRPEAFGLGPTVPQPLADSLQATLGTLGRAVEEEKCPEEDLAAELSQDADRGKQ
jgi:hypothetical protein